MEIVKQGSSAVKFEELSIGATFTSAYSEVVYMKISDSLMDDNVVTFETGLPGQFGVSAPVKVVKAKLTWEYA